MSRNVTQDGGRPLEAGAASDERLKGTLVTDLKRCGRPNCRCAKGKLHGPYYYRRWRDASGRQRKEYIPHKRVEKVRAMLESARGSSVRTEMRELSKHLEDLGKDAQDAQRRMAEQAGRHWHGKRIRERCSIPAEQRDRALYRLSRRQVVEACGWEITEDDFVTLQRMIRSERKRRNRLGLPWVTLDLETGQAALQLELNLWALPSYRKHVRRQSEDTKRR